MTSKRLLFLLMWFLVLFALRLNAIVSSVDHSVQQQTAVLQFDEHHETHLVEDQENRFRPSPESLDSIGCLVIDSVKKISDIYGNFNAILDDGDKFGTALAPIGDLNGDGIPEIMFSATEDDDSGLDQGALYIGFFDQHFNLQNYTKITENSPGFNGIVDHHIGTDIKMIGDLDGDGIQEIAVGENRSNDGGNLHGSLWIFFFDSTGILTNTQELSQSSGGLGITLFANARFGYSVAALGDINQDGTPDIAVGSAEMNNSGTGSVYIITLNSNGTANFVNRISNGIAGLPAVLDVNDNFGIDIDSIGDLDGNGVTDIIVGARLDDDHALNSGAFYLLFLDSMGNVMSYNKYSGTQGLLSGILSSNDQFGLGLAVLRDLDGDDISEFVIGAPGYDGSGLNKGAVFFISIDSNYNIKTVTTLNDSDPLLTGWLSDGDAFGFRIEYLFHQSTDLLLISARNDDDGGPDRGAAYIIYLGDSCSNETIPQCNGTTDTILLCDGDSTLILSDSSQFISWNTTYSSTIISTDSFLVYPPIDTNYMVLVEQSDGCQKTDTFFIDVVEGSVELNALGSSYCIGDLVSLTVTGNHDTILNSPDTVAFGLLSDTTITVIAELMGCPLIDSITITAMSAQEFTIIGDTFYCIRDSFHLQVVEEAFDGIWSTGSQADFISGVAYQNELFWVESMDSSNCASKGDSVFLEVGIGPITYVESPITETVGSDLTFETGGGASWEWFPNDAFDCNDCQFVQHTVGEHQTLFVESTGANGCVTHDTIQILAEQPTANPNCWVIPDAFTPNGDGLNDEFYPLILNSETEILQFAIYNRWGNLVHDGLKPWDGTYKGKKQSVEVFVYNLVVRCGSEESKLVAGSVTLLR